MTTEEKSFTHFNESGRAQMVDVSDKPVTSRKAVAEGRVYTSPETIERIESDGIEKGDVMGVAQIAGIMNAKRTSEIIPMCHPLNITGVDLDFEINNEENYIRIVAEVKISSQTGVEMEALTAVSTAALTIYDMCKAVDKAMEIGEIRLLKKSGGQSGNFRRGKMSEIVAVSVSESKGEQKENVDSAVLKENHGLTGDAHAGDWHRQVSLLAQESIDKMNNQGLDVTAGDFAENLTTKDIDLLELDLGTRIEIGGQAVLEITQHGKECHDRCAVYEQAGDCVMPREGIFAKVITGGEVKPGDKIEVLDND